MNYLPQDATLNILALTSGLRVRAMNMTLPPLPEKYNSQKGVTANPKIPGTGIVGNPLRPTLQTPWLVCWP